MKHKVRAQNAVKCALVMHTMTIFSTGVVTFLKVTHLLQNSGTVLHAVMKEGAIDIKPDQKSRGVAKITLSPWSKTYTVV